MKTFLFISKNGDSWDFCRRLAEEGHRAIVYVNDEDKRRVGDNIVEKSPVRDTLISKNGKLNLSVLKELVSDKPDCIVFDMVAYGFGEAAEKLRKEGYSVFGGSRWGDSIELNRAYGMKVMKAYKINTPKTYIFEDYGEAIKFVKQSDKPYVYKPFGNQPTITTYVGQSPEDTIGMLEHYSYIKEPFEIQEKIEGIEISSEIWINGNDVININHTMEEKHLMEGGKGPRSGSMGSVVWLGSEKSRLFSEGIGRIVPALKKMGYRGPIDLNTIVTKNKLYGLEWTARMGYDAIFALMSMYKGKISDLFLNIAQDKGLPMLFKAELGIAITISIPPFPLEIEPSLYRDVPLFGINKANLKHIWMYDIYKKGGKFMCSGNGGNLFAVTARGDKVDNYPPLRDAKRRALRTISNLIIPDMMYRSDIGDRYLKETSQLREWGWL